MLSKILLDLLNGYLLYLSFKDLKTNMISTADLCITAALAWGRLALIAQTLTELGIRLASSLVFLTLLLPITTLEKHLHKEIWGSGDLLLLAILTPLWGFVSTLLICWVSSWLMLICYGILSGLVKKVEPQNQALPFIPFLWLAGLLQHLW